MTEGKPPLVAHIIYSLGTGGLENGLVNIINRTSPLRYRHVIICLTTAGTFSQRITNASVEIRELHKKEGTDPGMYPRLWQCLRELGPDIIHTRNLAALDTQVLGLFLPGVKQVHGEHGRDIYDLDGSNWKYRMLRKFMRMFVDRYIAVSRDLEQWLLDSIGINPGKLNQIYNGVDHARFKPRAGEHSDVFPPGFLPKASAVVIGSVGRLAPVKDQAMILDAVALLLEEEPGLRARLRVVLVGDGPLMDTLTQQVVESELEEVVWMPGDRNDVPTLLQNMDIFLLPSLAEGISNTVLEAMATGLPVIATDTGGNPELIKNGVNGYLTPVGNFVTLAAKIKQLINSPDQISSMGQQSLACVQERFDWHRTVEEYLNVYDDLMGTTGASAKTAGGVGCENIMENG